MAAKSTILMIEFAIKARQAGHSIYDAACAAAKLRFRPVIMTSCSLIFGVIPLLMAHGPGAHSRFYLGLTVIAGMIAVTIIGTLLTPSAYMVMQKLRERFY